MLFVRPKVPESITKVKCTVSIPSYTTTTYVVQYNDILDENADSYLTGIGSEYTSELKASLCGSSLSMKSGHKMMLIAESFINIHNQIQRARDLSSRSQS